MIDNIRFERVETGMTGKIEKYGRWLKKSSEIFRRKNGNFFLKKGHSKIWSAKFCAPQTQRKSLPMVFSHSSLQDNYILSSFYATRPPQSHFISSTWPSRNLTWHLYETRNLDAADIPLVYTSWSPWSGFISARVLRSFRIFIVVHPPKSMMHIAYPLFPKKL